MRSIKDMIKDGKKVRFVQYKHGQLWYETECGFRFPVDTSDTGDGTFFAEDKAILFMRYIRKALEAELELLEDAIVVYHETRPAEVPEETGQPTIDVVAPPMWMSECPPAFDGCTCDCHRTPGMVHVMACCGYGRLPRC